MKKSSKDTIAAIATPIGEGGISVIRVSGAQAIQIASSIFQGRGSLAEAASHTAHLGKVLASDGSVVDEVVATVFVGPHSYTGENTVEMSCHGGILVTRRILDQMLEHGARHAEPGEFTKRAFLNGRIDLSQAEAIADLIHARSSAAHRASILQLEGVLSGRIHTLRSKLVDLIGLLELELDFVEEDLEFVDKRELRHSVAHARDEADRLMKTFRLGRIYREGVKVAIVGPPNAGKSSLLNALLESNRAIVTDIPGTTRDTIEEGVVIGGVSFRLVDTAGIRETDNPVEREGIRRTAAEAENSDIVLLVLDGSKDADPSYDEAVCGFREKLKERAKTSIVALNKADLSCVLPEEVPGNIGFSTSTDCTRISAKTGMGVDSLQKLLLSKALRDTQHSSEEGATVTSARHFEALKKAEESLLYSLKSLDQGESNEFVAVDLRNALDRLGEITGEVTTEEILNSIFSKFCVGK